MTRLDQLDPEVLDLAAAASMLGADAVHTARVLDGERTARRGAEMSAGAGGRTTRKRPSAALKKYNTDLKKKSSRGTTALREDVLRRRSLQGNNDKDNQKAEKEQDQKADKNNDKDNGKEDDKNKEVETPQPTDVPTPAPVVEYDPYCADSGEVFFYRDNDDVIDVGTCVSVAAKGANNEKDLSQACKGKIVEFDASGTELDEDSARRVKRACKRTCGVCLCPPEGCTVENDPAAGGGDVTTPDDGGDPEIAYVGSCSPWSQCPRCAGDCAGDSSSCETGLVCLNLDGGYNTQSTLAVPGCSGAASGATGWDYCVRPQDVPTPDPTMRPTPSPTHRPTLRPTPNPTVDPTSRPTWSPVVGPTTPRPSRAPTLKPTGVPSVDPTSRPTWEPVAGPTTGRPSPSPTPSPTLKPTEVPVTEEVVTPPETDTTTTAAPPEEEEDPLAPVAPQLNVKFGFATRERLLDPSTSLPIPVGATGYTRADYILYSLAYGLGQVIEERLDNVEYVLDWVEDRARRRALMRLKVTGRAAGSEASGAWSDAWARWATRVGLPGLGRGDRRLSEEAIAESKEGSVQAIESVTEAESGKSAALYVIEFDWSNSEIMPVEVQDMSSSTDSASVNNVAAALSAAPQDATSVAAPEDTEAQQESAQQQQQQLKDDGVLWHAVRLRTTLSPSTTNAAPYLGSALVAAVRRDLNDAVAVAVADGSMLDTLGEYTDGKVIAVSQAGLEGLVPVVPNSQYGTKSADSPEARYTTPLDPGVLDPIRVAGFALFAAAVFMSFCGLRTAVRRRHKRARREVWGTVLKSDQDLNDLLSVGLVMSQHEHEGEAAANGKGDTSGVTSRASASAQSANAEADAVMSVGSDGAPRQSYKARVFDEEELGYRKDDSMLMGGYQRTAEILTTSVTPDGEVELHTSTNNAGNKWLEGR